MVKIQFISSISFIFIVLMQFTSAYGQLMPNAGEINGSITGKVVDSKNNVPVEYASVALFSMLDDKLITGVMTDKDGFFQLKDVPMGAYVMKLSFVGYKKTTISKILVTPKIQKIMLGEIKMEESVNTLNTVIVNGDKPDVAYKIDRKVINVSSDLIAKGGTAADALENEPSVKYDLNGNVTLRGSGNFKVLIDGRPSTLQGSDALQQIPAESIESIEIITNPSAKYDPDGEAGIINVIMKKKLRRGYSGMVNASVGTNGKLGGSINLDRKSRKLSASLSLNASSDPLDFSGHMYRETYLGNSTLTQSYLTDGTLARKSLSLKSSIDYTLNNKNTFSLQRNSGKKTIQRDFNSKYTEFSTTDDSLGYRLGETSFEKTDNYKDWDLSYLHNFDLSGHSLETNVYYSKLSDGNTNMLSDMPSNNIWAPQDSLMYKQQSTEDNTGNEFRFYVNYTKPFSAWFKLEAGYQFKMNTNTMIYSFKNFDDVLSIWYERPGLAKSLDLRENIHSVYGLLSGEKNKFGYKLGLRAEYFTRNLKQDSIDEEYNRNFRDLFPTFHVSYRLAADGQLQASYSRRINRPEPERLSPFPIYTDKLSYRIGNPYLNPEYIDSYEFNFIKRVLFSFYSVGIFYKQTDHKITPVRSLNPDSTISTSYLNMNKDYSFGVEVSGSIAINDWWRINMNSSLFRYTIEGDLMGESSNNSSTSTNAKLSSTFKLKKGTQIQLNAFYNGEKATAQGHQDGFLTTSFAIKQDFFKNSLNITFQVRDIFNSLKFSSVSQNPFFYSQMDFHPHTPIFQLTCGFRFNKFRKTPQNEEINKLDTDDLLIE